MKKPLLNQIERQIIVSVPSFSKDRFVLFLATQRFKRELSRTKASKIIWFILDRTLTVLNKAI